MDKWLEDHIEIELLRSGFKKIDVLTKAMQKLTYYMKSATKAILQFKKAEELLDTLNGN